eukprot:TRINITY_DN57226_c0_g1_i1.p1 TRINITY_DN57226_c0_g1~~TRINITY_DN57226_c0_g1_i1.p1  ORF type:complete len:134 (-),score=22.45 TRINITY_DN57226_c0_g1_i1:91-471(-)
MSDPKAIAEAFYKHYYNLFDSGKQGIAQLQSLYKDASMLSFEETNIMGAANIVNHLGNLPFQKVTHVVNSVSVQPSGVPGALLVFVQGELKIDNEEHPMKFSQVWHLLPENGSFWVHNDIFRLNIA